MAHITLDKASVELAVYNSRGRALKSEILRRTVGGGLENARDQSTQVIKALNQISFEARDGDRIGLVGGNGAGKTTLLRVLSRVYPPTAGTVSFSELGEFLDLPIRTYSSGMMLRLAFGVSTAVHPDILILDEVIGVGDAAFAERAEKRLHEMIDKASIVFLASHDDTSVKRFCNRTLWLKRGTLMMDGAPEEVLEAYHADGHAPAA
jgi:ABC-type polysaccharide/polyol phosphate transport system ATPase subunit